MDIISSDCDDLETKLQDPTTPPIYLPLDFLRAITNNFSRKQELGRGGYGIVYKGVLRNRKIIAVKKLLDIHLVDDDQFQKEVTNLMGIKHKNIVQLVGYCADSRWEATKLPNGDQYVMAQIPTRLLCFEYLPNNSLDNHVSDETSGFDWNKRYEIMKEICNGLHYLHGECHIIHLDLKPENILMDDTWTPKIADFGLSKILGGQKSRTIINDIAGSRGYMAPEYSEKGVVSSKADIFSFGVIMIEIITGSRDYPLSTVPYYQQYNDRGGPSSEISLQRYREDVIGRWRSVFRKEEKYTSSEIYIQQVKHCIIMALRCVDPDSTRRPNAWDIIQMLNSVGNKDCQAEHINYSLVYQTGDQESSSAEPQSKSVTLEYNDEKSANKEPEDRPSEISCTSQETDVIISSQPIELSFHSKEKHMFSSCILSLVNNVDSPVAFRMVTDNVRTNFLGRPCGIMPPRCRYIIHVKVGKQIANENIALESIIGVHGLPQVDAAHQYNLFFTDAKNKKDHEVQQLKLSAVLVHQPRNMIAELDFPTGMLSMAVHPTETWIISSHQNAFVHIWDYCVQETVKSSFLSWESLCATTFITRKELILVADYTGYIRVYNYMTMEEIYVFKALNSRVVSFDIHPTEPYVLSASPSGQIKLWDWEKNWECIGTFEAGRRVEFIKFNTKDASYFGSTTSWGGVQVWNTGSPDPLFILSETDVHQIDFFTRGDNLHVIISRFGGPAVIWDCQSRTRIKTLEGHGDAVGVVRAHPDLPILITASSDGTVCLWNSFDFRFEGILRSGLGKVLDISCFAGSRSIVLGLEKGVARLTLPEMKNQL